MIYTLWLFIFILLFILIKLFKIEKNKLLVFSISLIIILFVINLKIAIPASIEGAKLWFVALLPTLFPFTTLCNLLIAYDGIGFYSKFLGPLICKPLKLSYTSSFPLLASFLCGYPLGGKYTSDLYEDGKISKKEYIRLANIASNCGPIFILGSVSIAMLNNEKAGYILLFSNFLSIILIGFLTIKDGNNISSQLKSSNKNLVKKSFGDNLKTSIENAISTSLMVGGFVILFCVVIAILKSSTSLSNLIYGLEEFLNLPNGALYGTFLGSIEITNGANILSSSTLSLPLKLALISFLCSFSGLSIIAQVSSFLGRHNFPIGRYIFLKLIQGFISFVITYCLATFIPLPVETFKNTEAFIPSIIMYYSPLLLLLLLPLLFNLIYKLFFHRS